MDDTQRMLRAQMAARDQGANYFRMQGFQAWTQDDFAVFSTGALIALTNGVTQSGRGNYAEAELLAFAHGFRQAWQEWQQIKARLDQAAQERQERQGGQ